MKDTKQKIFDAAVFEFANNGYRRTTVRDICRRAKVNVASINYHFYNKLSLYISIFEHFCKNNDFPNNLPDASHINSQETLEETIELWIRLMLSKIIFVKNSGVKLFFLIAMQELLFPSEAQETLKILIMLPHHNSVKSILSTTTLTKNDQLVKATLLLGKCTCFAHNKHAIEQLTSTSTFLQDNFENIVQIIKTETMTDLKYNNQQS